MHKYRLWVLLWLLVGYANASDDLPLPISQQYTWQAIEIQRSGLANVMTFIAGRPSVFSREQAATDILTRQQRTLLLDTWQLYQDYLNTLEYLADELQLAQHAHQTTDYQLYALAVSAHHRYAMQGIALVEADAEIKKILNHGHSEYGLDKHHYRDFRRHILSADHTRRYNAVAAITPAKPLSPITNALRYERSAIAELNRLATITTGTTARVSETAYKGWFPIQKGVARGMGKVKFWRIGQTLITPEQALAFSQQLEPGDFYVTRKEWRMTNLGIPGYWTHSALYIGTVQERDDYFNTPEVNQWVMEQGIETGRLEDLLLATSVEYQRQPIFDDNGEIRVVEALDAGVIFNSIETSLDADGFAAFRPRLTTLEKAMAIHAAFQYTGQPYDFSFDFDTDDAMVCSELLYKAYQPSDQQQGIAFPIERVAGRKMLTPNDIAIWFEETRNSPVQAIDLVLFVDSNEKARLAFEANEDDFLGSYQRPKWYAFTQPDIAFTPEDVSELELADQQTSR